MRFCTGRRFLELTSHFREAKNIDEPIADYAILPTFKMASEASKNFKVALSGEGVTNFCRIRKI